MEWEEISRRLRNGTSVSVLAELAGTTYKNMYNRIIFTKKFAKLEDAYVPVDFRAYWDVFVFCDADPIGLYLNQKRIKYHAVEDGLNYLKKFVLAKYTNRGHFGIKKHCT